MLFCALRKRRLPRSTALLVAPSNLSSRNASAFSRWGLFNLFSAWPNLRDPPPPAPQLLQLLQGRLRLATAVKQPIPLLHDVAQRPQLRQTTRQLPQPFALRPCEVM